MTHAPTVFTIGHSKRSIEAFVGLLRAHGVKRLFDVRRHPGSRRNPQFGQAALGASLEQAGIDYMHEPDLGGRRRPRSDSPNAFWQNKQFRGYADHMASDAFQRAVGRVVEAAREAPAAVMCAELHPSRCHRRLLADSLRLADVQVQHIVDDRRTEAHDPPPCMRRALQGHPVYPSDEQLDLFGSP